MADKLPPLNSLRAFHAAARNLSFTKAGLELNVTQAAVSYQVRRLEEHFGTKLFHRLNRALALIKAGGAYYDVVEQAFALLVVDANVLTAERGQEPLIVSASQSLAARWLTPRLEGFRSRNPRIRLHIEATDSLADLMAGKAHLALRYARKIDPALNSLVLFAEQVFPVCSPALLEGDLALAKLGDLRHHALIHDDMTDITWRDWLKATDVEPDFSTAGPSFSHSSLAIDAAMEGQGVALGRSTLIADDLEAGRLVQPFEITLPSKFAYHVVYFGDRYDNPDVAAFIDWVLLEAKRSEARMFSPGTK